MKVFAISDLHLPGGDVKPMDVFGPHWENHFQRIRADWLARVEERDVVLIPGDISWAMRLEEAAEDLRSIGALPGRKILLRGNHDYWWSAIGRVRAMLSPGTFALQNDAIVLDGQAFCGTRGWLCPGETALSQEDARIYAREVLRMELSLKAARRAAPDAPLTVMMHYPPAADPGQTSAFLELARAYGAARLIYGHLHGPCLRSAMVGRRGGMYVHPTSCDGLGFRLLDLAQAERDAGQDAPKAPTA
jgi:predicted phosphohydrolase